MQRPQVVAALRARHVSDDYAIRIDAPNGVLELLDGVELEKRFGSTSPVDRGLRLRAIRFGVKRLDETEALLRRNGIGYDKRDGSVIVHPAPGQGAIFAFEENA